MSLGAERASQVKGKGWPRAGAGKRVVDSERGRGAGWLRLQSPAWAYALFLQAMERQVSCLAFLCLGFIVY